VKNLVIVITGASAGIGAALAVEVQKRGAKGIVLAARDEAALTALAGKLGPTALAVPTDVTKRADLDRLRDRALAHFGQLDVLVNNAGRGITRSVSELTDADVDDMIAINVKSVLYGIQSVLPHFKEKQHGQIVTISSGLARFPFAAVRSAYSASKAAVNLLMGSLRMELRASYPNIHCTTVMPGVVATDFGKKALHGGADSRGLPGAQPVEEVAQVIANAIEKPVAECYTRPQMRELAAAYFSAEDVGVLEGKPPFFAALPPR
jgi:NAD(P)-dependent dehydrogenase (short-subunit alcohol dehydrogenase family)